MLAYASAYLKYYYPAAFTCALMNNQPMGFYHPAVLIKDAQRHGLRVLPVDITRSGYLWTLEEKCLRLGLNYVKGLRAYIARQIATERAEHGAFRDIDDLARRVPELRKYEMARLAEVGALNPLESEQHRRDALWKATRAGRAVGPLLDEVSEPEAASPLERMTTKERLHADYAGTGVTVGRHPMAYYRKQMRAIGVTPAADLPYVAPGGWVRVAGCVIVRQRPGTAKGILFLSIEDENGIANAVVSKASEENPEAGLRSDSYGFA